MLHPFDLNQNIYGGDISEALGTRVALVTTLAALHRPLFPLLDRISHTPLAYVGWRDTMTALGFFGAVFFFQMMFFN